MNRPDDAPRPAQPGFEQLLGRALLEHTPVPPEDAVRELRRHASDLVQGRASTEQPFPRGLRTARTVPRPERRPAGANRRRLVAVALAAAVAAGVVLGVRALPRGPERSDPAREERPWTTQTLRLGGLRIALDHPAAWRYRGAPEPRTPYKSPQKTGFLSTQVLDVPPCEGPRPCGPPVARLAADGVLVTVTWWPAAEAGRGPGRAIRVAGLPATIEEGAGVTAACPEGTAQGLAVRVRVSPAGSRPFDHLSIRVCTGPAGADAALRDARRLLTTVQITPRPS